MRLSQLLENETSQLEEEIKFHSKEQVMVCDRLKEIDGISNVSLIFKGAIFFYKGFKYVASIDRARHRTGFYVNVKYEPNTEKEISKKKYKKARIEAGKINKLISTLSIKGTEREMNRIKDTATKMPTKKLTLEDILSEGGPIKVWKTPEDFDRWLKKAKPYTIVWRGKMSGLQGFNWDKAYKKLIHIVKARWSKSSILLDAIKDWPVKYDLNETGNVLKEAQKKAFKACSDPNDAINRMCDYGSYKVYDFFIKLYGMDIKQSDEKMKEIKDTATKMPKKKLTLRK